MQPRRSNEKKTKGTLQTKNGKKDGGDVWRVRNVFFFVFIMKQPINDSISAECVPNLISLHSAPNGHLKISLTYTAEMEMDKLSRDYLMRDN